jgi:DNA-binding MarR family transcriptional regulator
MLAKQLWPLEQSAHLLSPGAERHGPFLIPPLIERWYEFAYTRIMREQAKKVAPECLGFRARLLSRVITATYDDALAKVGLKVSQFSVLNAVASREDTRPAELANFLAMDESTLSRNVARMCARGWLRLEHGEDDRRSHQITITDMGKALLRKSYPAWQQAQNQVTHKLGPDGVAALKTVVRKLRA